MRHGMVKVVDGRCLTSAFGWEVFEDADMGLSLSEEDCLALNAGAADYPAERAIADAFKLPAGYGLESNPGMLEKFRETSIEKLYLRKYVPVTL